MGKGSSPPPPPDYTAAAREQGEVDRQALREQTYANRPVQRTPWGSTTWGTDSRVDPTTGETYTEWTQNQVLADPLEQALTDQMGMAARRSELAAGHLPYAAASLAAIPDYDQFRDITEMGDPNTYRQAGEEAAYQRATSRLDPMFSEEQEMLEIKLRNQGLRAGDEAYEAEMDRFNRRKTDAYQAAINEAAGAGRAESSLAFSQGLSQQAQSAMLRDQEIMEALQERALPLEDVNFLLAGQGVQPPSAPGYSAVGRSAAPNLLGAATQQYQAAADAYNAQQAQRQGLWSGLTGLGSAALGMWSDRRLKRDIERLGTTAAGTPVYRFRYVWGGPRYIGVMAHDVPDAAFTDPVTGYQWVDYAKVR